MIEGDVKREWKRKETRSYLQTVATRTLDEKGKPASHIGEGVSVILRFLAYLFLYFSSWISVSAF
jgi:hypothetical protein